eukprot:2152119-Amphidinium_carterae.1
MTSYQRGETLLMQECYWTVNPGEGIHSGGVLLDDILSCMFHQVSRAGSFGSAAPSACPYGTLLVLNRHSLC